MSKISRQIWQTVKPGSSFTLKNEENAAEIWMVSAAIPRMYTDEYLPAVFSRTLEAQTFLLPNGKLEWVFTGPRGGFTVTIKKETVSVTQRHYDSEGLYDPNSFFDKNPEVALSDWFRFSMAEVKTGQAPFGTFPEKKWFQDTISYSEKIEKIRIVLDYKNALTLSINDTVLVSQACHFDIQRHQLKLIDSDGEITGRIVSPDAKDVCVSIDQNSKHQTMLGFGGTIAPMAYGQLSEKGKREFWKVIVDYNLLIHRENPIGHLLNEEMSNFDDLSAASPHYYGDNFPNGNISNFEINREIKRLGGQVWFEFWDFPDWAMADPEEEYRDDNGILRKGVVDPDKYSQAMVGYCKECKAKTGSYPDIVGIQNESAQPPETYHAMTLALRKRLDAEGMQDVKIHMQDANMLTPHSTWGKLYSNGVNRAKTFLSDNAVWSTINYAVTHMYDYQEYFNDPDKFDEYMLELRYAYGNKEFISNELAVNNGRFQLDSYRIALLMGMLYHKNLTILDAEALLYCWTIVNVEQPSFAATRSLLRIDRSRGFVPAASSHLLRVFGAFSRLVRRGMCRIKADTDDTDVLAAAFSGDDGHRTVVLMNRAGYPVNAEVEGHFEYAELVDPYNENSSYEVLEKTKETSNVFLAPGAIVSMSSMPPDRSGEGKIKGNLNGI